jgi:hypothetical protein
LMVWQLRCSSSWTWAFRIWTSSFKGSWMQALRLLGSSYTIRCISP